MGIRGYKKYPPEASKPQGGYVKIITPKDKQCKVYGCDSYEKHVAEKRRFRFALSKGYCQVHYKRIMRHGTTEKVNKRKYTKCAIGGCTSAPHKRADGRYSFENGMCNRHNLKMRNKKKPLYMVWSGMVQRCYNPLDKKYKDYGGRGIKMCDAWRGKYEQFEKDMGERPEGTSIDRIDVNGDYTPENCRWATPSVQSLNTRVRKDNTTGHTGVSWRNDTNRWAARLTYKGSSKNLGCYGKLEDAVAARDKAYSELMSSIQQVNSTDNVMIKKRRTG